MRKLLRGNFLEYSKVFKQVNCIYKSAYIAKFLKKLKITPFVLYYWIQISCGLISLIATQ